MADKPGFFERWRLRGRIRRAVRLRRKLRKRFRARQTYSVKQVAAAGRSHKLSAADMAWAYAIHCTAADFAASGAEGDYSELRQTVADLYLNASPSFAGGEGLSDRDAVDIGGSVDGGGGFDGGGDSGGGDGGGGGD